MHWPNKNCCSSFISDCSMFITGSHVMIVYFPSITYSCCSFLKGNGEKKREGRARPGRPCSPKETERRDGEHEGNVPKKRKYNWRTAVRIWNMSESSWRHTQSSERTIAKHSTQTNNASSTLVSHRNTHVYQDHSNPQSNTARVVIKAMITIITPTVSQWIIKRVETILQQSYHKVEKGSMEGFTVLSTILPFLRSRSCL